MSLVICAACDRHIRRTETFCPFCGITIAPDVKAAPERFFPTARLSRAALIAFAATYAGAGCGGEAVERQPTDGSGSTAGNFGSGGSGAMGTGGRLLASGGAPAYGIAAFGGYAQSSGGSNVAPPYGIAPSGGYPQAGGASGVGGAAAAGTGGGGGRSGKADGGGVSGASGEMDGGAGDSAADAAPD